MTAHIWTVEAAHDPAGAKAIRRANNPDSGLLTVTAVADLRRSYELVWELLHALGVDDQISGNGRETDVSIETVVSWMLAHPIRHVVVLDAQNLPAPILNDLCGLAALTGIDLWLVAHPPIRAGYSTALEAWPCHEGRAEDLVALLRPAPPSSTTAPVFPRVPTDNFLTFRAEARRHLTPDDFTLVDEVYRRVARETTLWLETTTDPVTETTVLGFIRQQLWRAATYGEMIVRVRAVQVAAFLAGWYVQADPHRLLTTLDIVSRAAIHNEDTWRRLRAYREPYRAAACVLAALECSTDQMLAVTLDDITTDGSHIVIDGETKPVPAGADLFVRAQLAQRRIHGATGTDLLMADDNGPYRDRMLVEAVRNPAIEVGVALLSHTVSRARIDPNRWAVRYGLSVQAL